MTVVLKLSGDSSLRCRFAVSPLNETTDALRALTHPGREAYHLPWQRQVRPRLSALGLGPLLALLAPGGYQPDFLAPPPAGPFTEFTAELEAVAATPADRVADEVDRWRRAHPRAARLVSEQPTLTGDPGLLRDALVEQLERAWSHLVLPWWPQLREVLDGDIAARARQLADAGTAAVLDDLHPKLRRHRGELRLALRAQDSRTLTDDGIVLLPSVFSWPDVGVLLDPPWQPTISYPARGTDRLWQPRLRTRAALARLIGSTRAAILLALDEPASTTGLAARCHLPLSTVSEHLAVLRANGLVATTRTGRYLAHQQTPLGTALTGQD
ncbi:MAG TPA: DUF5937 family protein [Jatrophihabitans sp.]|nr:DUF5937 family protein [Jatrophihabitans sp.]